MKKIKTLLSLLLFSVAAVPQSQAAISCPSEYRAIEPAKPCTLVISISGTLASKKSGCEKPGVTCLHFGARFIPGGMDKPVNLSLEMLDDHTLSLIAIDNPPKGDVFEVEEDVVLDRETAEQLGYASIRILTGNYKIMKDDEGHLLVQLKCESER